ncbi:MULTISPECIES: ELWxxDGT repeat protein [Flavobacterium]|uniref:ELWxxDGT repeat protein n=1 Tax=Flavobacterium TaxID=237 RepID=UPI001FCBCAC0|nr:MULTISPECIES: ELWxxDGT repeat protein [Flavobacterium]UOK41952.1 T9SS type A sorting domain-containing protein [Flavobacterium enshiense]
MIKRILVAFFTLLSFSSFSQDINLSLLDINKISASNPKDFVVVNNVYYFIANGLGRGYELWRSDGTESGTYFVKDINPGKNNAFIYGEKSNLTNINGVLYFSANDGVNGSELWKSDGTEAGTVMVKNINASSSSLPYGFTALNSEVIFACEDGVHGIEVWKTNGTESGTVLLSDISAGTSTSYPTHFIFFNNKVYFEARDGLYGRELWMTDGTSANTIIQNDLNSGSNDGVDNLTKMMVFNNELYFRGNDGNRGFELWKTNGAAGNATLVKDVYPGYLDGFFGNFLTSNSNMIFFDGRNSGQGHELWKSNGTSAGTSIVKDIYPGYDDGLDYQINFSFIGETLFFPGNNGNGSELWKSDGSSAGTVLVKEIMPGLNSSDILYMNSIDGTLYFSARQELVENKNYLWKSDGTNAGTQLINEVNLRGMDGYAGNKIFKCNNSIFFAGISSTNGWELWKTDGTTLGTNLFKDINYEYGSDPEDLIELNGNIIFSAIAEFGRELYKSNGTEAGTFLVKDFSSSYDGLHDNNNYNRSIRVGNNVFFSASTDPEGRELWKTDGTEAGTVLVKDIASGQYYNGLEENFGTIYAVLNGIVYFPANDGVNGRELWRSDGTYSGTYMVKDLTAGSSDSTISSFCVFNNKVFFVLRGGREIWYTDGTETGTQLFYTAYNINYLKPVGNKLFICGNVTNLSSGSFSVFVTDTTLSTPSLLRTFNTPYTIGPVTEFNNEFYFFAHGTNRKALFKSDGTIFGTVNVKDNLNFDNNFIKFKICGNNLYFTYGLSSTGGEKQLWRTDGTETGTFLLATATLTNYIINCLTCHQNQLFYFFDYPVSELNKYHYKNVWKTDGVNVSNHNLAIDNSQQFLNDNNHGAYDMFSSNNKIYFLANNGYSGYELYVAGPQNVLSLNEYNSDIKSDDKNQILIYPNPTNSIVTLRSNSVINEVVVFDSLGKKVLETIIASEEGRIDLSSLNSGLYLLKIQSNDSASFRKVIKK